MFEFVALLNVFRADSHEDIEIRLAETGNISLHKCQWSLLQIDQDSSINILDVIFG